MICILMGAASVGAEIVWERTEATVQVHPVQVSCEASFCFTNKGDASVTVSSIDTTCGCLHANADKAVYAAGETGRVVVDFDLRGRIGSQRKYVTVHFSDGTTTALAVTADIPEIYQADTQLLTWEEGDGAVRKTVHLQNRNTMPIKLLSITSSHEGLPATLKTIREGYEYEVVVTRTPEVKQVRAVIRLETEPPQGMTDSKTQFLYVVVR